MNVPICKECNRKDKRIAELDMLLNEYKDAECRAVKREGLFKRTVLEALKRIAELEAAWNSDRADKEELRDRVEELEAQLKECEDELRGYLVSEGLILGGDHE
jgi:predicted nuclease with TOPRIM domain